MYTIKLYKYKSCWMAEHDDPAIKKLFGSGILPTAFTSNAPADVVLREIESLNPDKSVIVCSCSKS